MRQPQRFRAPYRAARPRRYVWEDYIKGRPYGAATRSRLSPTGALVLLKLATFADPDGRGARPSFARLARGRSDEAPPDFSLRTVTRAIAWAAANGFLEVDTGGRAHRGGRGIANRYTLRMPLALVDEGVDSTPENSVTGDTERALNSVTGVLKTMSLVTPDQNQEQSQPAAAGRGVCAHGVRLLAPGSCPVGCERAPQRVGVPLDSSGDVTLCGRGHGVLEPGCASCDELGGAP